MSEEFMNLMSNNQPLSTKQLHKRGSKFIDQLVIETLNTLPVTHWVVSPGGSRSSYFRHTIANNENIINDVHFMKKQRDIHIVQRLIFRLLCHYKRPLHLDRDITGVYLYRGDAMNMLVSQMVKTIHKGNCKKLTNGQCGEFTIPGWIDSISEQMQHWLNDRLFDTWFINTDKILDNKNELEQIFNVSFDEYHTRNGDGRCPVKVHETKEILEEHRDKINELDILIQSLPDFALLKTNNKS